MPLASPTLFCNIQHLISQLKEERNKKEKEEEEKKKKSIRFHISHPAGISHPSSLTLSPFTYTQFSSTYSCMGRDPVTRVVLLLLSGGLRLAPISFHHDAKFFSFYQMENILGWMDGWVEEERRKLHPRSTTLLSVTTIERERERETSVSPFFSSISSHNIFPLSF